MYAKLGLRVPVLALFVLSAACQSEDEPAGSASGGASGSGGASAGSTGSGGGVGLGGGDSAGAGAVGDSGGAGGRVSDGGSAGAPECSEMVCVESTLTCIGCPTAVTGIPHIVQVMASSDLGSTVTLRLEDGAVCASGTAAGWAGFGLLFAEVPPGSPAEHLCAEGSNNTEPGYLTPFDAAALGIERIAFTIESPPAEGVSVGLMGSVDGDPGSTEDCPAHRSFFPMDGWTQVLATDSTPIEVALTDFEIAAWENANSLAMDPTQLTFVRVTVEGNFDFDFCLRDLKFLDANGVEVAP